jgi:hypothetical protein
MARSAMNIGSRVDGEVDGSGKLDAGGLRLGSDQTRTTRAADWRWLRLAAGNSGWLRRTEETTVALGGFTTAAVVLRLRFKRQCGRTGEASATRFFGPGWAVLQTGMLGLQTAQHVSTE